MGKTILHTEKAKYNRGDKTSQSLENYFNRSNNNLGRYRSLKKIKMEKIISKDLDIQLREILKET